VRLCSSRCLRFITVWAKLESCCTVMPLVLRRFNSASTSA